MPLFLQDALAGSTTDVRTQAVDRLSPGLLLHVVPAFFMGLAFPLAARSAPSTPACRPSPSRDPGLQTDGSHPGVGRQRFRPRVPLRHRAVAPAPGPRQRGLRALVMASVEDEPPSPGESRERPRVAAVALATAGDSWRTLGHEVLRRVPGQPAGQFSSREKTRDTPAKHRRFSTTRRAFTRSSARSGQGGTQSFVTKREGRSDDNRPDLPCQFTLGTCRCSSTATGEGLRARGGEAG